MEGFGCVSNWGVKVDNLVSEKMAFFSHIFSSFPFIYEHGCLLLKGRGGHILIRSVERRESRGSKPDIIGMPYEQETFHVRYQMSNCSRAKC